MANEEGYCWPSLEQLSDRFGRSKSAISGYPKELREEGLIDAETQKTANGYNHRLKYRVTFRQDWRGSLTRPSVKKIDRSVRPVECLEESKKQSLSKPLGSESCHDFDPLLSAWARCVKGASYPQLTHGPTAKMLGATYAAAQSMTPKPKDISAFNLSDQTTALVEQGFEPDHLERIVEVIQKNWASHWRRAPDEKQFQKLVSTAGIIPRRQKIHLLST